MKYLIVILSSIVILSNGQQPGGKKDLDVHSQDVIEMTKFAFEKIELASNSIYKHKMGEIIKAQSQVVQGTMYFITFEFHETSCKKNQNDKDVPCDVTVRLLKLNCD